MAHRKRKEETADPPKVDEREWTDWWALRDELGKRLGGRDATGVSDDMVLEAARQAGEPRAARRKPK